MMQFKRQIYMRMPEGANLVEHLNEFMNVIESLAEIDVNVPDEKLVILLLVSLALYIEINS